jgi:polysaccharide deacetylase family protein (PEP-CTERM system associated)
MSPFPPTTAARQHILTVVLEDYCHVGPLSRVVPTGYWSRFESRVVNNTRRTLDLLDQVGAKATFFVLGWIGEHQPEIVAEVARRGHEVASKGYWHRSIRQMTPSEFREDVQRSRAALEAATGKEVRGYRIPRGGFSRRDLWALDVLSEEGMVFDSSLRPLGFEFADEPFRRYVHEHVANGHRIWEVPLSTYKKGGLCLPISGGNFVRQLPHFFIRRALDSWTRRETAPLVFYFHVWELDPEQPRITAVTGMERIRQYRNLDAMVDRIGFYLRKYPFGSVADYLKLPPQKDVAAAHTLKVSLPHVPRTTTGTAAAPLVPITVAVPCYNEEATLGYLGNTLAAFSEAMSDKYEPRFLFVDDGSKDRTWARLNELFGDRADCILVQHPKNRGVAAATLTGVRNATTNIVCVIDCDGTYDPLQLRNMIPMLADGVDIVTASPYHSEGEVLNLPAWRLVLSKGLSVIYRFVHHNKLATYTSCFRVYRRRTISEVVLRNEGFVGVSEILSRVDMQGGKVVECPAVMQVRLLGSSKMKVVKTIIGHLKLLRQLTAERWGHVFHDGQLKPIIRKGEVH